MMYGALPVSYTLVPGDHGRCHDHHVTEPVQPGEITETQAHIFDRHLLLVWAWRIPVGWIKAKWLQELSTCSDMRRILTELAPDL
jgi:hypothetical protein